MSKSSNMLRTRRRDNSVKPNRRDNNARLSRLDRKSSRGMIYENEELRLRTININAEIERGQYDIKKLKRENELLKKEIWSLRDEYDKLDKMLKDKVYELSSSSASSTTCSNSCSCSSEEDDQQSQVETSQNLQNVQKTSNMRNFDSFDHLSIVPEENSSNTENSDQHDDVIPPDQSYPPIERNFFSPICNNSSMVKADELYNKEKSTADLIVEEGHSTTFSNGGNLEELLNDIESISQDILKITTINEANEEEDGPPFKSELNVVLMPSAMPLLGFDKYKTIQSEAKIMAEDETTTTNCDEMNPFYFQNQATTHSSSTSEYFQQHYNPDNFATTTPQVNGSKTNLLELTSSDLISSENEENLKFHTNDPKKTDEHESKEPKLSIRRKVSIHFKGNKKDKSCNNGGGGNKFFDMKFGATATPVSTPPAIMHHDEKTPSLESKKSTDFEGGKTLPPGSEKKTPKMTRKSQSISPERRHVQLVQSTDEINGKKHKKHNKKKRRGTIASVDRTHRERSYSICTDRSNNDARLNTDEYSEREQSVSSCETIKTRKMSNISNVPLSGKVPWCACWGNGCI